MIVLEIFGAYLALAALFYLGLTLTAAGASPAARPGSSRWHRVRLLQGRVSRRLRALPIARPSKRPH